MLKHYLISFCLLVLISNLSSQPQNTILDHTEKSKVAKASQNGALFSKGDKVAFVGNSITHSGEFHHNIFLYYITRFPKEDISFFNCGISGDVTGGILKRMNSDILIHQPTHAVIMIGMNDVGRYLYGVVPTQNIDTLKKREAAIALYKTNLDSIVRLFLAKGIKIILQKPTIYDQTAVLKTFNNFGVNDALKQCADYVELLSRKYNLPVVDYWSILNNINIALQKKDSTATIVGLDRVHPTSTGHLIMAYQFLKTMRTPRYVSKIVINNNFKKSQLLSENCSIENFAKDERGFTFKVKENALPFPTVENQKQALDLVSFTQDLNVEELRFSKLKAGRYQVVIDTVKIGVFTAEQLKYGVNLAQYSNSPQYQQALAVRKLLTELWVNEANLRTIKWVEFGHLKELENKTDLDVIKAFLEKKYVEKLQNLTNGPYYKGQFEKYIKLKPNEKEYVLKLQSLKTKAYQAAQPIVHNFQIIKLD